MPFDKKRILITGGTGFIGTNLILKLINKNISICVIGRSAGRLDYGNLNYEKLDIFDKSLLMKGVNNFSPDYIIHLAANNSHEETQEVKNDIERSNIIGTRNLLEATESIPYKRFIFLSSGEVYFGNKPPFSENMVVKDASTYSRSKIISEEDCKSYIRLGKPITIVRASVVYGPGQRSVMFIPSMIDKAIRGEGFDMTKGEQTRDFIFVSDLADAILKACTKERATGEIINVGTGIATNLVDVVKRIRSLVPGFRANIGAKKYRNNEIMEYYFDISKARRLLGWVPRYTLEKGIRETFLWQKNQM